MLVTAYQASLLATGPPGVNVSARFERVWLDDAAWVDVARGWLLGADTVLDHAVTTVDWRCGRRWMYERFVDDPRLSCFHRDSDPPPHPALGDARHALGAHYRAPLSGPGLNYYRDGQDSVAWHRDRELRHLDDTLVAIVTLGAQRPFLIRPRHGGRSRDFRPASGDLLVMGGRTQADWEHCVPKIRHAGPRVSASWRWSERAPRVRGSSHH